MLHPVLSLFPVIERDDKWTAYTAKINFDKKKRVEQMKVLVPILFNAVNNIYCSALLQRFRCNVIRPSREKMEGVQ